MPSCFASLLAARRLARRSVRSPQGFCHRSNSLCRRIHMVRFRAFHRHTHPRACFAGSRRSPACARKSRADQRFLLAGRTRSGHRHLVRLHHPHRRHRPRLRRLADRSVSRGATSSSSTFRWQRLSCSSPYGASRKAATSAQAPPSIGPVRSLVTLALGAITYALIEAPTGGHRGLGLRPHSAHVSLWRRSSRWRRTPRRTHGLPRPSSARETSRAPTCSPFALYAALGGIFFFFPLDLIQVQR